MNEQIHSGLPWTSGAAPVLGEGWVQIGGPNGKKVYFDELSKADQDLVIQYLLSAQFPMLIPPATPGNSQSDGAIAAATGMQVEAKRHEIVTAMLDHWLADLQKTAQENKRADEKRTIEKLDIAYHEIKRSQENQPDSTFPIFAVGFIILGGGIHQALAPDASMTTTQTNPIFNMSSQIIHPIMPDMRAELGLIGAIFATGIQYFTVAQIASNSAEGKGPLKDAAFAKGYAENMLALVGSGNLNNYIMAIVSQNIPGEKETPAHRALELVAMVKVILLSSALAMLYQVEAGKMTGAEFAAMLSGNIKFELGDLRANLVLSIKSHLKLLAPQEQAKLLTSLLEYFDGNPSLDALGDPSKVVNNVFSALPRGELTG